LTWRRFEHFGVSVLGSRFVPPFVWPRAGRMTTRMRFVPSSEIGFPEPSATIRLT
jgi:hypothetical protein